MTPEQPTVVVGKIQSPPAALTQEFRIHGMDCADEVAILKREVGPAVGGEGRLGFDILNGRMIVTATGQSVPANVVIDAVRRTGMRAEVWSTQDRTTSTTWQPRGRMLLTGGSGIALAAGFIAHVVLGGGLSAAFGREGLGVSDVVPIVVRALYGAAIILGGWSVAPKAWYSVRRLRPDMNLLMAIAVVGAVGIGEWFEAGTVAFLFAVSLALEAWSVGRSRRAVETLMALAPTLARVRAADGSLVETDPAQVAVGAHLLIKPGERVPLDGRVTAGASAINQAPITGESVPVEKETGSPVFAGTINGDGALEVEVTKAATDSTLARIVQMVGEAQRRRAPSEQWVERFARVYTPSVLVLAVVVALGPPLVLGAPWSVWFYRSLVLLVIGCPCALVISTPVTIVAGLAAAARNGVLVKGGMFLEAPARLRAIAFDKTGTLTRGTPVVTAVVPLEGYDEASLLERIAGLEARSDHPLARAVLVYAAERGIVPLPAEDFRSVQGKGAIGRVGGKIYWLGSHRYLEERGQETAAVHDRLDAMTREGLTAVVVGTEDHVCGFVTIADAVRPDAREALDRLRRTGIRHIVMLTGDNNATARAIGTDTGVDEVFAELLPEDKVAVIERLVATYGQVGMVGDGVNDAPAMARASIGIAMGAAGSDTAIETADIALMTDDLTKLAWLVGHSRRALSIIRQNIGLSLCIKAIFVVLTFGGVASLWAAIAADMGVSLLVISNALRLLRINVAHERRDTRWSQSSA